MRRSVLAVFFAMLVTFGCGDSGVECIIELRSDLTPLTDFTQVVTEVDGRAETLEVRAEMDFVRGERVARFALPRGVTHGELRIVDSGGVLFLRPFSVALVENVSVVTLVVSRDCAGIECPGTGSPLATACLEGRCVSPECTVETPEYCEPVNECDDESACALMHPCSRAQCRGGSCVHEDGGECGEGLVCEPASGCQLEGLPLDGSLDDVCPDSSQPDLEDGLAIAKVGDDPSAHVFVGAAGVDAFVPTTLRSGSTTLEVAADGSVRLVPGEAGEWLARLMVLEGGLPVAVCARVVVLDETTREYLGGDWRTGESFAPVGVPDASEAVFVRSGVTGSLNSAPTLPRQLYIARDASVEWGRGVDSERISPRALCKGTCSCALRARSSLRGTSAPSRSPRTQPSCSPRPCAPNAYSTPALRWAAATASGSPSTSAASNPLRPSWCSKS